MPYRLNAITGELDLVDTATIPDYYVNQFDADTGSAVPAAHIINLLGTSAQGLQTSASGNTVTFTVIDATISQKGVAELSTDAETIDGSSSSVVVIPSSLTSKLGTQTQYAVPYGNTTSGAFQWTGAGSNGQLIIGATGGAPAFASLTSVGGTVTFSAGANSLNLEASGSVAITFDTDSGSAVPALNTININGTAAQGISTSGATNVVTITASDATTSQKGVLETSTDAESIAGSSTAVAVTPASLAAKLGTQTANAIPYGAGTSSAFSWTSAATDGQLVIGATSAAPAFASLTSSDSSITISGGSNTLDIVTGDAVADSFPTDSGTATPSSGALTIAGGTLLSSAGAGSTVTINADDNVVGSVASDSGTATPSSNSFTIAGGAGVVTSATGSTVTIAITGSGFSWADNSGTFTAVSNNGYFITATSTATLPASPTEGDSVAFIVDTTDILTITANTGQVIRVGNVATATGGTCVSMDRGDAISIVYRSTGSAWIADGGPQGDWTLT